MNDPVVKEKVSLFHQVYGFKAFGLILLASIIAGFSDAHFGWNVNSLRQLISMLFVFLFLNYGGALVRVINGVRRKRGIRPRIAARPVYLIFLLVSVLFARLTDVQPALIFGAVLALEYSRETNELLTKYSGRAAMAGAFHNMLVGVCSWLLYSVVATLEPIVSIATSAQTSLAFADFALITLGDLLAMMTVAALAALPISLLPFSFVEGIHIWRWSKIGWGITYVIAASVYTMVLVSLPSSWSSISVSWVVWVSTYLAYFAVAIGLWAYLRYSKVEQ